MALFRRTDEMEDILYALRKDLARVKMETVTVLAEEKMLRSRIEEIGKEAGRLRQLAETAVAAGNEEEARRYLQLKKRAKDKENSLQPAYKTAILNAEKMRQLYQKLTADIQKLESRRDRIVQKRTDAELIQSVTETRASSQEIDELIAGCRQNREQVNQLLDRLEAEAKLAEGTGQL